jgi:hypothetical protein
MSNTITPINQKQTLNPYQGRLFDFDTSDSRVYLSASINSLFGAIGQNCILEGFDILNLEYDQIQDKISLTITPGKIIIDSTLIDIQQNTNLDINVASLDQSGKLFISLGFTYIPNIYTNNCIMKLLYVSSDSQQILGGNFVENYDRIIVATFDFDKINKSVNQLDFNSIIEYKTLRILNKDYEVYPESFLNRRLRMYLNQGGGGQGLVILSGQLDPSQSIGALSNYYLNTTTLDLFKKYPIGNNVATWNLIGNLLAPTGYRTGSIELGNGVPTNSLPKQHYFDKRSGKWFTKINNVFTFINNLTCLLFSCGSCSFGGNTKRIYPTLNVPNNSFGNLNEHHFKTDSLEWYTKSDLVWDFIIDVSFSLTDSSEQPVIIGCGTPFDEIGTLNYNYFSQDSYNWYVKELVNNVEKWVLKFNLFERITPLGGQKIWTDVSTPQSNLGYSDNYFLSINNTSRDDLNWYYKQTNTWNLISNFINLTGFKGNQSVLSGFGPPNPSITTNGTHYFRKDTYDWYYVINNTWVKISNTSLLKQGNTCSTWGGDNKKIIVGTHVPLSGEGNIGEHYLDNLTLDWYTKENLGWMKILDINLSSIYTDLGCDATKPNFVYCGDPNNLLVDGKKIGYTGFNYFRTDTYDLYQREAGPDGNWVLKGNLSSLMAIDNPTTLLLGLPMEDLNLDKHNFYLSYIGLIEEV